MDLSVPPERVPVQTDADTGFDRGGTLLLDGVYAEDGAGSLRFHPAAPPTGEEMDQVLATIARRIRRLLARRGVVDGEGGHGAMDPWGEQTPVLAGIAAASVQGRVALGPRAGAETRRCGSSPERLSPAASALGPCHARADGFDLHAGVVVPGRDRARLERTCRYALRPPVAHERIHLTPSGQVLLELRHRWADGTTHLHPTAHSPRGGGPSLLFEPIELLERLAALTPRPRINLVLYYGVLGAHAAWRSRLGGSVTVEPSRSTAVASMDPEAAAVPAPPPAAAPAAPLPESTAPMAREANVLWAHLMQRSFPPPPRLRRGLGGALRA